MEIRFLNSNGKVIAIRTDMTSVPRPGDRLILQDDNSYVVNWVAWDLLVANASAAVVELDRILEKKS